MKIVFMGTPDFALPTLQALCERHQVICVYCQAPKEAGRGQKLRKSPVQLFAESRGIEVRTPKSLRSEEEQRKFAALHADIAVVAAYGLILPKAVIEAFPKGCLNVHGSLLPRWRGAAPVQRAIEAGDEKSGVTIMQIVEQLDAGAMYRKGEIEITPETTGGLLHDQIAMLGAKLMTEVLAELDGICPEPQDEKLATYAAKIDKSESLLDFRLPAAALERKIRAFNPYPATYFEHNGERLKVLSARVINEKSDAAPGSLWCDGKNLQIACGEGQLEILLIQRSGKKPMPVSDFLRGYKF